ncbi:MAG: chromate transporter [Clostridia bacterium]|nr:chromate transporter [Clostridia bacterium]
MKENRILKLLFTFLKIGAFTFGGGYAMIPVIQREIVDKHKWITEDDILDIIAIAESTPGPIAINSATFVGYRVAGVLGSAVATFGVVFPAFMLIYIISFFLRQFEDLQVIKYAFAGIRAGVLSLLINALISMGKKCPKNILSYIVVVASFALVALFDVNVLFVIIGCAVTGVVWSVAARKGGKNSDLS